MTRIRSAAFLIALATALPLLAEGRIQILTLQSKALAGNLAGDPAEQKFAVYTPQGYETGTARYPVVFLLHGIADSYDTWIRAFDIGPLMDELIAAKKIPPLILVMPNARNKFLGSYYLNSPVTGRWADFIADEIVSKVDAEFRTKRGPAHRAVMGHSMGGFGAIHFGMTRPDVFSAVYAMSPCCLDAIAEIGSGNFAAWSTALQFKSFADAQAALQRGDFYSMAALGLLSAMAPKPGAPLNVEFPYRLERNEIYRVHPAYENLLDQFPVNQVKEHRANLSTLRLLALDFGYDDHFAHIPPSTMSLSRALYDAGVPHRLDAYAGDHRQKLRERMRTIVFPAVTAVLDP